MWSYFVRWGPVLLILLIVLFDWHDPHYLWDLENRLSLAQFQWLRPNHASSQIVIASLDDETFSKNYFNRKAHGEVIKKLSKIGVACYFYDVEFDETRGPEMDQALAEAVALTTNGVMACALHFDTTQTEEQTQQERPFLIPPLMELVQTNRCTLGLVNVGQTAKSSEFLLAAQSPDKSQTIPSAALAIFCVTKHVLPSQMQLDTYRINVAGLQIPSRITEQKLSDGTWQFYKMTAFFQTPVTGPAARSIDLTAKRGFRKISYARLIEDAPDKLTWLSNKIILIGEDSSRNLDIVDTAVGPIKGVEVHANILNTLMGGHWPRRLAEISSGAISGWQINGVILVLFCAALNWHLTRQTKGWQISLIFASHAVIYLLIHLAFLEAGYILKLSLAIVCYIATLLIQVTSKFEASRRLLRTFVPEVVANQLLSVGQTIEGEIEATVIVTDIRGYTTLSETKTPKQILLMLNEYHTETVAIFERFHGNVLNYQGDAQIVIFGYPRKLKDAPERAIQAGLATAEAVERLRTRWGITDRNQFDVGCGICTGPVAVGELGAAGIQAEYTVIGETVRLCHKVQGMSTALEGNVLMDQATYNACQIKPPVKRFDDITLEGIVYPVSIFRAEAAAQKK